ncbi:response regulator [Oleiharenicola lentus]|uniref:response regulator n=1 Tax=Oleiharenicola lentus TaxID=2508720 RepID=UPI003F671A29
MLSIDRKPPRYHSFLMTAGISIVLIEDHAIVRGLIERVAEDAFPGATVSAARDGKTGLELCQQHKPRLVLLDLELPDADGFELVSEIRKVSPGARILILSSHTEDYILHRVHQVAVEGFMDKNDPSPEMLTEALQAVASGGRYFSATVENAFARFREDPLAFSKLLSEREQELLRLLGQGLSDEKISEKVGLREITVRNHRRNIMARLGIHSTPELIRYALEHGFARARLGPGR